MINIKEIADYIYDEENTQNPRDFVENYQKYQSALNSIDDFSQPETYDTYSRLVADYGIALTELKSYKKAIPVLNKALELFLKNKKITRDSLPKVQFYETLIFKRGFCYYHLDKYKMALSDFELLVELYPDNSIYPKWIFAIKNK